MRCYKIKGKILIIGSVTIDEIEGKIKCGGPATYCSLASWLIGWKPYVVGTMGSDFQWFFPFEATFVKLNKTIRFKHTYLEDGTRFSEILYHPENKISAKVNVKDFDAVIINPVFDEFDHEWLEYIVKEHNFTGIDLQGFVREKGENNRIKVKKPDQETVEKILNKALIVKASDEEVLDENARYGKIFILTLGRRGAITHWEGQKIYVPTIPVDVEPTGAGDIFLATFLTCLIEGNDVKYCTIKANAVTSYVLEHRLLTLTEKCVEQEKIGDMFNILEKAKEDIEQRLRRIAQKMSDQ